VYLLLLAVIIVKSYLLPDVNASVFVMRTVFDEPPSNVVGSCWSPAALVSKSKVSQFTPFTSTLVIESGEVPVFLTVKSM